MREPQKVIDNLESRCAVYKIERLALLKIISDLSDILTDKFRTEDRTDGPTHSSNDNPGD